MHQRSHAVLLLAATLSIAFFIGRPTWHAARQAGQVHNTARALARWQQAVQRLHDVRAQFSVELARAHAASAATYPVAIVNFTKEFTAPLVVAADCTTNNNNGGIIPAVGCLASTLFPTDLAGTYSANSTDGTYYRVTLSSGSQYNYTYYVQMWVDTTLKNGAAQVQFMNYWFDPPGSRGKMEIFPDPLLATPTAPKSVLSLQWDNSIATAETLTLTYEGMTSAGQTNWAQRQTAFNLSTVVNTQTSIAEIALASNSPSQSPSAWMVNMRRNGRYTVSSGSMCDPNSPSRCSPVGYVECATNFDPLLSNMPSQQATAQYMSGLDSNLDCGPLLGNFTMSAPTPSEANLGLLSTAGLLNLQLP